MAQTISIPILASTALILLLMGVVFPLDVSMQQLADNTIEYTVQTGTENLTEIDVFYLLGDVQQGYEKMLISSNKTWTKPVETSGDYGIKVMAGGDFATAHLAIEYIQPAEETPEEQQTFALFDPLIAYAIGIIIVVVVVYSLLRVLRFKREK